ncbi:pseudaminic acid cytidylyltransferase [Winogradskyella thalassocola]|uniref:N-acylneuraminate cytidylyltransferase n=1 Tax=Winogradskyella thalassocola TaxID=262004 RepID=A0A1G7WUG5_9FLAO|nr:pseudaminic acid cytidylyltransferase [Winogradskyella thalassocola]SDG75516.1 N-acylneuraminate cytidylyltransferase [Winogradskyella thalassocola]
MKKIAIIPARGGSKRIPRKNIKFFLGKPIIAYSIEAALKSNLFDEVMVSTDDKEIAKIAIEYGAKVPFLRSEVNSNDVATTIDVIAEVIEAYKKVGQVFDYTCCIYPCAPFVTEQILTSSYKKLKFDNLDCVFPVLKYGHPIQRALKVLVNHRIKMIAPENMQLRTQDLEASYHDLGQFYMFKTDKMITQNRLWNDNTGYIELKEIESHDIDTVDDWEMAEFKYKYLKNVK